MHRRPQIWTQVGRTKPGVTLWQSVDVEGNSVGQMGFRAIPSSSLTATVIAGHIGMTGSERTGCLRHSPASSQAKARWRAPPA